MARITDNDKNLIIADYHTGKYSQRDLAKKYDVSIGTINKITKEINPENEHLVNAQMSLLSAKAYLTNEQMNAIMNTAKEELFNKGLVTNASQLAVIRSTQQLARNSKKAMTKVKQYNEGGQVCGESIELYEIELDSTDIKNNVDSIDKASITLGVSQRHANSQVNIQNTNAIQANIDLSKMNDKEISSYYLDIIKNES